MNKASTIGLPPAPSSEAMEAEAWAAAVKESITAISDAVDESLRQEGRDEVLVRVRELRGWLRKRETSIVRCGVIAGEVEVRFPELHENLALRGFEAEGQTCETCGRAGKCQIQEAAYFGESVNIRAFGCSAHEPKEGAK